MATEGPNIFDGSQTTAAVDLSASQFYCVKVTAARSVNLASTGGEAIYGVLQNKPTLGQPANVAIFGITKAASGAAFSAAAYLMTDSTGRLITATGTNHRVAQALEAATAAGQLITVAVGPNSGDTVA
jgi:ABC-type uncharacterized transport system permease subunit